MQLAELAETSGVSTASIKFYRREGLLPPGRRLSSTQQDYGQTHLDRLALIQVLREMADAPIPRIAALTAVLDDPEKTVMDALTEAQMILLGPSPATPESSGTDEGESSPGEHPAVLPLMTELGWPDVPTRPREALNEVLRFLDAWGWSTENDLLLRFARPVASIAETEIGLLRSNRGEYDGMHPTAPTAASGPAEAEGEDAAEPGISADVTVMRAISGSLAYDRLIRTLRLLGQSSLSILAAQRGEVPGQVEDPT